MECVQEGLSGLVRVLENQMSSLALRAIDLRKLRLTKLLRERTRLLSGHSRFPKRLCSLTIEYADRYIPLLLDRERLRDSRVISQVTSPSAKSPSAPGQLNTSLPSVVSQVPGRLGRPWGRVKNQRMQASEPRPAPFAAENRQHRASGPL